MARGMGRPLAALVLSDEERSFLEAQVRRHRVARSMSDRCRMILRCADGLSNKAVAAEFGVARIPWASGAGALSESASTDCRTTPGRGARGPSRTARWPR